MTLSHRAVDPLQEEENPLTSSMLTAACAAGLDALLCPSMLSASSRSTAIYYQSLEADVKKPPPHCQLQCLCSCPACPAQGGQKGCKEDVEQSPCRPLARIVKDGKLERHCQEARHHGPQRASQFHPFSNRVCDLVLPCRQGWIRPVPNPGNQEQAPLLSRTCPQGQTYLQTTCTFMSTMSIL